MDETRRQHVSPRRPSSAVILEDQGSAQVLHVFGDLSHSGAGEFESTIMASAASGKDLTIDFSECRHLDFTIISMLVRVQRLLEKTIAVNVDPGSSIARLFKVFELNSQFGGLATVSAVEPL